MYLLPQVIRSESLWAAEAFNCLHENKEQLESLTGRKVAKKGREEGERGRKEGRKEGGGWDHNLSTCSGRTRVCC